MFLYKYTNTRMSSLIVCLAPFIKVVSYLQSMAEETSGVFLNLGSIAEESYIYIYIYISLLFFAKNFGYFVNFMVKITITIIINFASYDI